MPVRHSSGANPLRRGRRAANPQLRGWPSGTTAASGGCRPDAFECVGPRQPSPDPRLWRLRSGRGTGPWSLHAHLGPLVPWERLPLDQDSPRPLPRRELGVDRPRQLSASPPRSRCTLPLPSVGAQSDSPQLRQELLRRCAVGESYSSGSAAGSLIAAAQPGSSYSSGSAAGSLIAATQPGRRPLARNLAAAVSAARYSFGTA
jgi:hypothetical protein